MEYREVTNMLRFGRAISKGARLITLVITPLLMFEGTAAAQVSLGSVAVPLSSADQPKVTLHVDALRQRSERTVQPIRDSLSRMDYGRIARQRVTAASAQTAASGRKRSVARRVLGGAIGATGGLFAGGFLGAAIEGDRCNCDDPGLMGALIGAPVGAVTGGILGALFF
jgi:hypothetical protein